MDARPMRSLLYVPADNAHRVAKAFQSGADAVILDLEDAVANSKKVEARESLKELLSGERPCPAYVRVNSMATEYCLADIEAAVRAGADGISLPKVESAKELFAIDWIMSQIEANAGIKKGSVDVIPVIESGVGLAHAATTLAGVPRARRAGLGVGDLSLELNIILSSDQHEAHPYRNMLLVAAQAAGMEAPLDTVYLDVKNLDGLRDACITSRRMGFQGRRCIHPAQVPVVNEIYTPTDEEIARAERIVAEFGGKEEGGLATMMVGETFVDYPIAEKAQRLLSRVAAIREGDARRKAQVGA
jgi:citrate lyase subunit beta/citryl-CoA lyase